MGDINLLGATVLPQTTPPMSPSEGVDDVLGRVVADLLVVTATRLRIMQLEKWVGESGKIRRERNDMLK